MILIAAHISRRDVDLVDKAIEQMKSRIIQLVNDSIRDQFYGKAMEVCYLFNFVVYAF